jgi:hypothetical protein
MLDSVQTLHFNSPLPEQPDRFPEFRRYSIYNTFEGL